MGAQSSAQTAAGDIQNDEKMTENSNFGLLNISLESLGGGAVNFLGIATFALVAIGALYCLKVLCQRHRQRRLQEMQSHLQGITIDAPAPRAPMPVVAARVPIIGAPPPVYPGDALASAGKKMMQAYE